MAKPPSTNFEAMWDRHVGCLPMLLTAVITIGSSFGMSRAAQYVYITSAYGQAAWDAGLRVPDNKGRLSNGEQLSGAGRFVVYVGGYLLTVPFFLGAGLGLPYLAMRLRGERFAEQLARWKEENRRRGKIS